MQHQEYERMYALEDHYWWFVARRELALSLLDAQCKNSEENLILDIGCGTGVVLSELGKRGTAVGFDFSPEALSFCTGRSLERLVQGDAHHLPIASGTISAIVSLDVFEHLERDCDAFAEAYRVLKPGGVVVLSVPAFRFLWGPHDVALMHFRRYRKPELRKKLIDAGFSIDRISYSVFFLFPLVCTIRALEKLKPGPAHASLPSVPEWLNKFLIALQRFESKILKQISLPWGSSVVVVARKPLS